MSKTYVPFPKRLAISKREFTEFLTKTRRAVFEMASINRCPIAQYVRDKHPGYRVEVDADVIRLVRNNRDSQEYDPPKWVTSFIEKVDSPIHDAIEKPRKRFSGVVALKSLKK